MTLFLFSSTSEGMICQYYICVVVFSNALQLQFPDPRIQGSEKPSSLKRYNLGELMEEFNVQSFPVKSSASLSPSPVLVVT